MPKGGSGIVGAALTEGAMTDVPLKGDGVFQRGKDPKIDGGSGGDGLTNSPLTMGGQGLPSPGEPIMGVDQGLTETPNSMSGMPAAIHGETLGAGDPGPGGHVEPGDLGGVEAANAIPTKSLTDVSRG